MSNPDLKSILTAALRSGIAHNNGGGGQYLLCATEAQLCAFAAALTPTAAAAMAATVPHEKLTHEIDMVLTDPDTKLSPGAVRALQWCRTWVSVPLQLAPAPVAGQPAEPSPASPAADAWATVAPAVEANLSLYREVMAEREQPFPALMSWDQAQRVAYQAAAAFRPSCFDGPGFQAHEWVVEAVRSAHLDGQLYANGKPPLNRSSWTLRSRTHEGAAPKGDSNG